MGNIPREIEETSARYAGTSKGVFATMLNELQAAWVESDNLVLNSRRRLILRVSREIKKEMTGK